MPCFLQDETTVLATSSTRFFRAQLTKGSKWELMGRIRSTHGFCLATPEADMFVFILTDF